MPGLAFFERIVRRQRQALHDLTLFVLQFGPAFQTAFIAARTRVFTSHMFIV